MIIFVAILGGLMNKIRGGIITAYYAQYLILGILGLFNGVLSGL